MRDPAYPPLVRTLLSLLMYAGIYYLIFRDMKSISLLLAVILIHETGHFIAMRSYGYTNVRMLFVPLFGAFVSGKPAVADPSKKMIVLLAGPLPGIVLGMLALWLYSLQQGYIFYQLSLMFIILNVFNLLPLTPMDGGQMLELITPTHARLVQTFFVIISSIALGLLAYLMHNYFLLVLVLLMWYRLMTMWRVNNSEKESAESGMELSALNKISYAALWAVFMVLPMVSLYKVLR